MMQLPVQEGIYASNSFTHFLFIILTNRSEYSKKVFAVFKSQPITKK